MKKEMLVLLACCLFACCFSENTGTSKGATMDFLNVRLVLSDGSITGMVTTDKVKKSDAEWRRILTPEQYNVTRRQATECAFTGALYDNHQNGIYFCVDCGLPLFSSATKFESHTGWPSFFAPIAQENVLEKTDGSHGMQRTEILCARCGAHLGHVFEDGPAPTRLRYCMNSAALNFIPEEKIKNPSGLHKAVFGAGCFWGVEEAFRKIKGVEATAVGYMGGTVKNPSYEQVCTHATGHAEVTLVIYNPQKISYDSLLKVFWSIHDPTTLNRQGPDIGSNYRSVIFYATPEQEKAALDTKAALEKEHRFKKPMVTEISPAKEFYRAEEYHQRYDQKTGNSACAVH